eukprot:TRINITY_DN7646_c0_g1_i1.p1 TRINITY_DN7646_c0_g1~~TRINITY_DN7646_c0_g1_i1.p1  ORF type:complete len:173 (+),score=51.53 TRINITY_DN7646_c0_g1_i1:175-693(+)
MASSFSEFFNKRKRIWDAAEIYANKLYYGSGDAADNLKELKSHKITHILNVADDVPNFHPKEFTYINLKVRDMGMDTGISRVFDHAFEKLDDIMKQEEARVLVHCAAGRNRSATITIAYMMYREGIELKKALDMVTTKRRVFIMKDNRRELMNYEMKLYGKNTVEMEAFLVT